MDRAAGRLIVTAASVIGLVIVACTTSTDSPSAATGSVSAPVSPSARPAAVQVALQERVMVAAGDSVDGVGVSGETGVVTHEQTQLVTVSLDATEYGLQCTIYGGSDKQNTYRMGMRAALAVS